MHDLTKQQKRALDVIKRYWAKNGYSPSIKDISAGMGFEGENDALGHIRALQRKGKIDMAKGVARSIRVIQDQ